jgi:hypothetical protein
MPLQSDPKGGGSNADGTRSTEYCSYCFIDGKFVNPDMTLPEMKALIVQKMQEKGIPKFVAGFFTLGLSQLQRWKK